jgi:solute carrier family 25 oxoglutarate transporter 11
MGEVKKPQSRGVWPTVKPFVNGGASGMLATCVIQPIDMIKVHKCLCFWLLEIF